MWCSQWSFKAKLADILAIIKTCKFVHKNTSIFSTIWQQEYNDAAFPSFGVNINSIARHCLMTPKNEVQSCYQRRWHCERWTDEFMNVEYTNRTFGQMQFSS